MPHTRLAAALFAAAALGSGAQIVHAAAGQQFDFTTRYAAGVAVARGEDPYAGAVISGIERELVGEEIGYVFRDPPPVAWFFRAVSVVPYGVAQRGWDALALLCAGVCVLLALRAVGARATLPAAAALALVFAPLRYGLTLGQIDPLVGALSLVALTLLAGAGAGVLQAVAVLKPQTALLASVAGVPRGGRRYAAGLIVTLAVLVAVTAPMWPAWVRVAREAGSEGGAWRLPVGAVPGCVALVLARWGWPALRDRFGAPTALLCIAACLNAAAAPFVFLNLQSDVLVIVPLVALAMLRPTRRLQLVAGAVAGVFAGDGLFAVTYYSGVSHSVVPIAVVAAAAAGVALAYPEWRLAAAIGLLVNVAITLPAFSPDVHEWLSVAVALGLLLALVSEARQRGGRMAGHVDQGRRGEE